MRPITRATLAAMTILAAQFITGPAQAHLTDPPHDEWIAGFQHAEGTGVYRPGALFQTETISGRYQAAQPFDGVKDAHRTYDITFPAGFTLDVTDYPQGSCAITNTTVHCESGIGGITATWDETLIVNGTTGQIPDGLYQIGMTSTVTSPSTNAGEPPTAYTDTDTMPIEIRAPRTVDLATTGPNPNPPISAGVPTKYNLHVRNQGATTARDVTFSASVARYGSITTNTSGCESVGARRITCIWPTLAAGASKTIEVIITPDLPRVDLHVNGFVTSYENDSKPDNDSWEVTIRTK
ncbi:hypothetical protein [Arthrobacter humicola]